jgi:Co/Zn/Cd efflux system component
MVFNHAIIHPHKDHMSSHCHSHAPHTEPGHPVAEVVSATDPRYRRVLWVALLANLAMFGIEVVAGWGARSVSMLADAIDFFGDAANYGVSLWVLSMAPLMRSRAALLKAACMLLFGLAVAGRTLWSLSQGSVPEAATMGWVGTLALGVNLAVAWLLYSYRNGDANMRSVWLCTRNDALGNLAVVLAAVGVFGTGSAWPDLTVAAGMAVLAVTSAWSVARQARVELWGHSA